uniref:Putative ribonuclease H-like domain-containing protein n=1 Tax=Tanacetum cinerariifolium TaxID=118510 RepID=A0A6L2L8B3_TANCI|nr:putative ribonuclease H-like domain-containing protein [Tanacetum cinerariifolium]
MESLSPQVVSAAKPPILNPNEFDLWKMRIEQYFLMTDYSLWEVILNGDSLSPTRVVNGVLQPVAPTTAKHSNTESVSVAASVSAIYAKMLVSSLPNVDSLSNAVIYSFFASQSSSPQFDNEDLKQIDVECYNCHRMGHFARKCSYDWSFQAKEEPANYAHMAFSSLISSSDTEGVMKVCPLFLFMIGTNHAFIVKLSPTKPDHDLSHIIKPLAPIIEDWVSDSEDESETKTSQNVPSFVHSTEQVKSLRPSIQHVKTSIPATTPNPASPKPTGNGKCRNKKACFVCKSLDHLIKDCDYHDKKMAQPTTRNHAHRGTHKQYAPMNHQNPQRHMVPVAILTQSKPVPITAVRPLTADVPKIKVTRTTHAKPIVTKTNSPTRRHITHSPSQKASNSPPRVTAVKAPVGNPQHALKDKGVIDSGCSRHMIGNMSYLSDFEELNGGYVTFGGNPKGGKISGKGKIRKGKLDFDDVYFVKELKFNIFSVSQMCDKKNSVLFTDSECLVLSPNFKLPDESQVLLRVPRENNMYNVNLKNIVPSRDLTCRFAKPTIDEYNLWHRRLGHINFKTMNKLVKGKFDGKVYEGFLVRYSVSIKAFRVFNNRSCIVQETLPVNFLENKPNVAGSGPTWLFDIDSLTKTMNYQLVTAGNQSNPSAEFEDLSDNSINEVNAAGTLVPTVRQISPNSTNTFSAVELEDITYSDYEDDVGAEGDFNNLETSITVSPIPTTRVHKDHPVTQIIGDLSLATQTRSMTRELLQFKMQKVWVLVNLPYGKRAIGTKWVFRNKKDERGIVVRNKARLVAQGHTQEEGIDYKEVFTLVARIEAIRLFLAYASFMGFIMYQIDIKSAFLYGTIKEEVYVYQPLGFEDPDHPDKVYKVVKALYGLHQAPKACQDKYIAEILRKFRFTDRKSASTLIDTEKPLLNDPDGVNTPRCDEDRLELMELTVFLLPKVKKFRIGVSAVDLQVSVVRLMLLFFIKYALPVNPNIYVSCIKQFWTTVAVKKVNDVIRLQALVDKKKVVCMSAKRASWNEFSSSIPSTIICLSSGRKFNFSKYIFDSLVRNVDSPTKFYMYPRFLQLMIRKQVGDLSTHTTKYTSPVLTQKVFVNMRRVGKGFSGVDTPLFKGMLVAQEVQEGDADENVENVNVGDAAEEDVSAAHDEVPTIAEEPSIPSPTPPNPPLQPSQDIPSTSQAQPTPPQSPRVQPPSPQPQPQPQPSQDAGLPINLLQDLMDTCTALTRRVKHLELDKVAQAMEITKLKQRVKKLERRIRMIVEMDQDVDIVLEDDKEVSDDVQDDIDESAQDQGMKAKSQAEIYKIDLEHTNKVLSMQEDKSKLAEVQEVVDVVTTAKIITKVVTAASETITATSTTITALEVLVPAATTAVASTLIAALRKRTKGVVIRDPEESTATTSIIVHSETKSKDKGKGILVKEPKPLKKQAQIEKDEKYARELEVELKKNIDWDEVIDHVKKKAKEDHAVKRYQALKRKPQTEAQARKNMMIYLKNVVCFKMDYFKGISYDDIRPIFEAKFNINVAFLQKTKEQIEEKESRALKRLNETPTEIQKLDEEVEELKRHLQIVPNKDNDVYTEATPLARKVLVVDYEINE